MGLVLSVPALAFATEDNGDDTGTMSIVNITQFQPGATASIKFTAIDSNLKAESGEGVSPEEGSVTHEVVISGPGVSNVVEDISLNSTHGSDPKWTYSGSFNLPSGLQWGQTYTVKLVAGDNDDQNGGPGTVSGTFQTPTTPPQNLPEVPYAAALPVLLLGFIPVVRRMHGGKGSHKPIA